MGQKIVLTIVFVFLLILGGRVEIPLEPVPFILTDFFVFLGALWFRPRFFAFCVLLFLSLGALGVPVYADGAGGFKHLVGPTSGYLFGYLLAGFTVSVAKETFKKFMPRVLIVFLGYYFLFVLGVSSLMLVANLSLQEAVNVGAKPFVLSMHLKALGAVLVVHVLNTLGLRSGQDIW